MNQSNLFQRTCPEHPEKQVICFCFHKSCYLNRLLCKNCMKFHSDHFDNLLDEQEIQIKIQESSNNYQQFNLQLNQIFDDINSQFKQFLSTLETQYNLTIDNYNLMENKKLNKYLNNLIMFKDKEIYINQLFTNGLNDLKQQINQCLSNLSLEKSGKKKIVKENMKMVENYLQQGNQYYKNNDFRNAIKVYDQALQINQNHLLALNNKGDSLFMLGQYIESIEWYDKALMIDPQYLLALCSKGDSLFMSGQYKEAIEQYDKALAIDPQFKIALYGKGDSLRRIKQYTEALKYLNIVLQIDSNDELSLGSKGACLIELGQLNEAEKSLNQAIKLDPNNQFNRDKLKLLKDLKKKK